MMADKFRDADSGDSFSAAVGAAIQPRSCGFHEPAGATINGKPTAAEQHLVHKSADGKTAVVGILVKAGAENPAYKSVWDNQPAAQGPVQQVSAAANATAMLPAIQTTYRFLVINSIG